MLLVLKTPLRAIRPVALPPVPALVGARTLVPPLGDVGWFKPLEDPHTDDPVLRALVLVRALSIRHPLVHVVPRLIPPDQWLLLPVLVVGLHPVAPLPLVSVVQENGLAPLRRGVVALLALLMLAIATRHSSRALLTVCVPLVRLPWLEQVLRLIVTAPRARPVKTT